jgi:hypothetical protein
MLLVVVEGVDARLDPALFPNVDAEARPDLPASNGWQHSHQKVTRLRSLPIFTILTRPF